MAEDGALEALGAHLGESLPLLGREVRLGELTVRVAPESVVPALAFLRDDERCRFRQLIDLCGVDYPEREERFEVVYHLLSVSRNHRVRLKTGVAEGGAVPSAVEVFPAAGWYEREVWDLYGVPFAGHPDLRRILTDYGFQGHPLRRDFPLTGHVEVRYDDAEKRVVYEPVRLGQEFRDFDFESPWEGAAPDLPAEGKPDG